MTSEITDFDTDSETPFLAELGAIHSLFESRRLRWAICLVLITFGLNLLLNIEAILRLSVPEPQFCYRLSALFDPVYQTSLLTLVITVALLQAFFRSVPYTFQRLAKQKVIDEKEKGQALAFVQTYRRWLDHPARFLVGVAFAATSAVVVYYIIFGGELTRLLPGKGQALYGPYAAEIWLTHWINGLGIPLALFVIGNILLKVRRAKLPRPQRAGWSALTVALPLTLAGLVGNVLIKQENLRYFLLYFVPTVLVVGVMPMGATFSSISALTKVDLPLLNSPITHSSSGRSKTSWIRVTSGLSGLSSGSDDSSACTRRKNGYRSTSRTCSPDSSR